MSKPLHAYGSNNLCEGVALIANAVGDGPFKQFLRRVAAADQVPSCEGCKYAESWHLEGWIQCTLQFERDAPIAAEISGGAPIIVKPSYGCFEWEPKA
jgi:hypothetical protein